MSAMPKLNNRYELREIIGEGGMGIVYRAVDRELKRDVALKTIKELLDSQQLDWFLRECDVLKQRNTRISSIFTMPALAKRTERRRQSVERGRLLSISVQLGAFERTGLARTSCRLVQRSRLRHMGASRCNGGYQPVRQEMDRTFRAEQFFGVQSSLR